MVESDKKIDSNVDVKSSSCNGVSEVRKHFLGVRKMGKKWQARIRHPTLKFEISLGNYYSPEEAALAVEKKKTEFQEMFNGENSMNVKTCRDEFEGMQLPPGVSRRGLRRWGTQIFHPGLKRTISLGSYNNPEEASIALDNKRDEFLKMYGWRPNVKRGCKTDNQFLEGPNWEVVTTSKLSDKLSSDVKVSAGVKKLKSGEWCPKIIDPVSFHNTEEAVAAKTENATGLIDCCPISVLGSDNVNCISNNDELNTEVLIANVPDKPEYNSNTRARSSHISVSESGNSDSANASYSSMPSVENDQKSSGVSEFDEATSLGIINEYGQLVGIYSELDEQMEFTLPDEDIAEIGCYI